MPGEGISEKAKVTVSDAKPDDYPCLCKPKCEACQSGKHQDCGNAVDCTVIGY